MPCESPETHGEAGAAEPRHEYSQATPRWAPWGLRPPSSCFEQVAHFVHEGGLPTAGVEFSGEVGQRLGTWRPGPGRRQTLERGAGSTRSPALARPARRLGGPVRAVALERQPQRHEPWGWSARLGWLRFPRRCRPRRAARRARRVVPRGRCCAVLLDLSEVCCSRWSCRPSQWSRGPLSAASGSSSLLTARALLPLRQPGAPTTRPHTRRTPFAESVWEVIEPDASACCEGDPVHCKRRSCSPSWLLWHWVSRPAGGNGAGRGCLWTLTSARCSNDTSRVRMTSSRASQSCAGRQRARAPRASTARSSLSVPGPVPEHGQGQSPKFDINFVFEGAGQSLKAGPHPRAARRPRRTRGDRRPWPPTRVFKQFKAGDEQAQKQGNAAERSRCPRSGSTRASG